jgi:hypothetical protein
MNVNIAKKLMVGLVVVASVLATAGPAYAYHERGGDGYGQGDDRYGNDGGDYGNGNDQRRCHESQNCRGSFSPGPFDRSPVDVHDNCVSLDCSGSAKDGKKQPPAQGHQTTSLTDPTKLPQVIVTIIKSGLDMGQLFATTTIKFVEDLFVALA